MAPNDAAKDILSAGLRDLMAGALDSAERCAGEVLENDSEDARALHLLGLVHLQRGEVYRSLELIRRAAIRSPQSLSILSNLGAVQLRANEAEEAVKSFRRALAISPGDTTVFFNLGNALVAQNRLEAAAEAYLAAMQDVTNTAALGQYVTVKRRLCDWQGLEELEQRIVESCNDGTYSGAVFPLLAIFDNPALHRSAAEGHLKHRNLLHGTSSAARRSFQHAAIRVAYVSYNFGEHPGTRLIAGALKAHDGAAFEIFAISLSPDDGSELRRRIRDSAHDWLDAERLSDTEVVEYLRAREIDVAVDLNGLTSGSRLGIFKQRAAPVQISYLGYPGSVPADYIDYVIADSVVLPPEGEAFYHQKVIRLPHCYQPGSLPQNLADTPSRAQAGLPAEGFVFCSFNNSYKITAPIFDIWMNCLRRTSGSVLWLLADNARQSSFLKQYAADQGIAPERLVFAPRVPQAEHFARHRLADLFLDTFPYNAHTTARDALSVGVPIVTRMGRSFASRVAASLLSDLGLHQLITESAKEYESAALEFANEPERLAAVKRTLVQAHAHSPLFKPAVFARSLEDVYTRVVRDARA